MRRTYAAPFRFYTAFNRLFGFNALGISGILRRRSVVGTTPPLEDP